MHGQAHRLHKTEWVRREVYCTLMAGLIVVAEVESIGPVELHMHILMRFGWMGPVRIMRVHWANWLYMDFRGGWVVCCSFAMYHLATFSYSTLLAAVEVKVGWVYSLLFSHLQLAAV